MVESPTRYNAKWSKILKSSFLFCSLQRSKKSTHQEPEWRQSGGWPQEQGMEAENGFCDKITFLHGKG